MWLKRTAGDRRLELSPSADWEMHMLFAWIGFLKEGSEPDQEVQQQVSGFLQQPYVPIQAARCQ